MTKECLKTKRGSCLGCNVLEIAINHLRWRGGTVEQVRELIANMYCPDGLHPDVERAINKNASYTMGQSNQENTDGLDNIGRPALLNPSSGKKMSKSSTGRWYRD